MKNNASKQKRVAGKLPMVDVSYAKGNKGIHKNTFLSKYFLVEKLAAAWNHLDVEVVFDHLSQDVVYEPHWEIEALHGRVETYLYLASLFDALPEHCEASPVVVAATIAYLDAFRTKPCLIISQMAEDEVREVVVLVSVMRNKITRIEFRPDIDPSAVYQKMLA